MNRSRRLNRVLPSSVILPAGIILLALGLSLILPPSSLAANWATTGSLNSGRAGNTATRLYGRQVLVAGGYNMNPNSPAWLNTSELYNQATGNWTYTTGNLTYARWMHTATLLTSGKVLVAGGGSDTYSAMGYCELYNPATGQWTATGNLSTARLVHTATLLTSGKVLVAGGQGAGGANLNSAELYDPTGLGSWSSAGSLATARRGHTATRLSNGKVLVVGGWPTTPIPPPTSLDALKSAELYDPAGGWSTVASLNTARAAHSATLLTSGKVLVAGGCTNINFTTGAIQALSSAEVYDPATNSWTTTGSLPYAVAGSSNFLDATLLANGKVLLAGGANNITTTGSFTALTNAELYDPAKGTWAATDSLNYARAGHRLTLLATGQILASGGWNGTSLVKTSELYGKPRYSIPAFLELLLFQ
jgi:N-acetylneuraminic acid mutarotase